MFFLKSWYLAMFYKPILNFSGLIYKSIEKINPDTTSISIPIIIISIIYSVIWTPIIIAVRKNISDKKKLELEIKKSEAKNNPEKRELYLKKIKKGTKIFNIFISANFFIQFFIVLSLKRFVKTGITGKDNQLFYSFWEGFSQIENTQFFKYDLSKNSFGLSFILFLIVILFEGVSLAVAKTKAKKSDQTRLIVLPVLAFFIFWFLPSICTLFIIITTTFLILGIIFADLSKSFKQTSLNQNEEKPNIKVKIENK